MSRVQEQDAGDLAQAAGQFLRRVDVRRQSFDARRQGRIGRIDCRAAPAHRRLRIDGRFQIITQSRAKRSLVPLLDGQLVDHRRPQIAGIDVQQFG